MGTLRFSGLIKIRGINPYLLVSSARAAVIKPAWRKPMPVLVRINGRPRTAWRINMMPTGTGSFYLYLHGAVRKASDTKVGDRVIAEVRFNSEYRGGPPEKMPRWFAAALRTAPPARKNWEALPPSHQKEILRYLLNLKSSAARARNIEKAIRVLSRGDGRGWNRKLEG